MSEPDRVLVLDDDAQRGKWFRSRWPGAVWCRNGPAALKAMREEKFDLVFLDHDLGEQSRFDGSELANRMAEERLQQTATILIHTANPAGAAYMMARLQKYKPNVGCLSFPRLRQIVDGGRGF